MNTSHPHKTKLIVILVAVSAITIVIGATSLINRFHQKLEAAQMEERELTGTWPCANDAEQFCTGMYKKELRQCLDNNFSSLRPACANFRTTEKSHE